MILIDESGDRGRIEQLILYLKWFNEAEAKIECSFVSLIALKKQDAESIFEVCRKELEDVLKIDLKKYLFAFGSDGASVMTGNEGGVGIRFQEYVNRPIIRLHCICHQAQLTCKEASKSSQLAQQLESVLKLVALDFSKSLKKSGRLRSIQLSFDQKQLMQLNATFVRWLSRYKVIQRNCVNIGVLLNFYKKEAEEKNDPRYSQIAHFTKLKFLFILADVLFCLNQIKEKCQSDSL